MGEDVEQRRVQSTITAILDGKRISRPKSRY